MPEFEETSALKRLFIKNKQDKEIFDYYLMGKKGKPGLKKNS